MIAPPVSVRNGPPRYRRRLSAAVWAQLGRIWALVEAGAPAGQIEQAMTILSELTGQPRYDTPARPDHPYICVLCRQPTADVPGGLCKACQASLAP